VNVHLQEAEQRYLSLWGIDAHHDRSGEMIWNLHSHRHGWHIDN
jgi:hypothetical protein